MTEPAEIAARQAWMGLLARANPNRLAELFPDLPPHDVLDALMQADRAGALAARVLAPLQAEEAARRSARAAKAAATKVEFFTLVRGEDQ